MLPPTLRLPDVVTAPPSAMVMASSPSVYSMRGVFIAVEAVAVVNAPVEAELAPIVAPSTVPPLISGLVRVLLVSVLVELAEKPS